MPYLFEILCLRPSTVCHTSNVIRLIRDSLYIYIVIRFYPTGTQWGQYPAVQSRCFYGGHRRSRRFWFLGALPF